MDTSRWLPEEEIYLTQLSRLCQELSNKYKLYYELYKMRQARFRIPSIIISSVTGLLSFGSSNFPVAAREYVSISVGIASLFIALINSIETFMRIAENMSGSAQASIELQKLKEFIDMELALPLDDRPTQGIIFLRDCYTRYERILDIAPNILKTIRFIKPSYTDKRKVSITIAPHFNNSDDIENDTRETYTPDEDDSSRRVKRVSIGKQIFDKHRSFTVPFGDKRRNSVKEVSLKKQAPAEKEILSVPTENISSQRSSRRSIALPFIIPK